MLTNKVDDLNESNEELINEIDDLHDKVDILDDKLEETRDTVKLRNEDVNIKPDKQSDLHMFAVLQDKINLNVLLIIRGQNKHLTKKMTNNYNILINKTYNPNPIDLWVATKDYFKKLIKDLKEIITQNRRNKIISYNEKKNQLIELKIHPPIKFKYSTIILNFDKMSLNEFLSSIHSINNKRLELPIP